MAIARLKKRHTEPGLQAGWHLFRGLENSAVTPDLSTRL
jgi:hypothetical protein